MKRVWITLGLTLMLLAGGGQGYHGFGTDPACGQPPPYPPPPYNNPYYYPSPYNYYNYYSAPYTDPLSQFLYYVAPQIGREGVYEDWEHRGRKSYKYRGRGWKSFERRGHEREHD